MLLNSRRQRQSCSLTTYSVHFKIFCQWYKIVSYYSYLLNSSRSLHAAILLAPSSPLPDWLFLALSAPILASNGSSGRPLHFSALLPTSWHLEHRGPPLHNLLPFFCFLHSGQIGWFWTFESPFDDATQPTMADTSFVETVGIVWGARGVEFAIRAEARVEDDAGACICPTAIELSIRRPLLKILVSANHHWRWSSCKTIYPTKKLSLTNWICIVFCCEGWQR